MSDQSLREALVAELRRHGVDEFFEVRGIADAMARVSAAHPTEPAPVVTDEAVEAAAMAVSLDWENYTASMRTALTAAAPLLDPRPLLDREAVLEVLAQLDVGGWKYDNPQEFRDRVSGALLKLAQPMLTPEQIDAFLQEWRVRPGGHRTQTEAVNYRRKMRNALLALLGGAES